MNTDKWVSFLSIWIASSLVFVLSSMLVSGSVVLGNDRVVPPVAVLVSGVLLALLMYAVGPAVDKSGLKIKDKRLMVVFYFLANFVGIWVIKRLERITGVGISSVVWVGIIAVLVTVAQWVAMRYGVPMLLGKKGK